MRNYIERAKDFVQQVFPYINGLERPWEVRERIRSFNADFNRKVIVKNGCARIALITSDYVVKYTWDFEEACTIGDGANEVSVYAMAKAEGFDYLFAEITPFEYKDMTFYIMPRIYHIGEAEYTHADSFMNEEEQHFCERMHLTDLHWSNFGFRNKKICIVDYAYILNEEAWEEEEEEFD